MAKSALCIGINDYPGTGMDLKGCVNDAEDWALALGARGFAVEKLLDSDATKANMVAAIDKHVRGAASGDVVVITFSGHGTYAPDADGEEPDGLDEALCPYDIKQRQVLIDDEIHTLFRARRAGVRITLISDSCHSGTVTRAAPVDPDAEGARPRFLPLGAWLPQAEMPRAAGGKELTTLAVAATESPWSSGLALTGDGDDLLLAGCEEGPDRFSYDAAFQGRPNGAFSFYALKELKKLPANATYSDWHAAIRRSLPSASFPQKPQIFGSTAARKRLVLD
jgi:hypothetical protein